MSESSDSADIGSTMKTSLRRSSTSGAMANAGSGQTGVTNGATEGTTKQGMPALRQRSASLGKVAENEGSKRKRDLSPQNDTSSSSPEPPKSEVTDMGSDMSCTETPITSSDAGPLAKRRKSLKNDNDLANDIYCWVCHKEFITGQPISYCKTCPRSYHTRCIPNMEGMSTDLASSSGDLWACPECRTIDRAENVLYRSQAMQLLTLDQLCTLLKFSLSRMKAVVGAEPFLKPVDPTEFPRYSEYVVNAMDMSQLEKNVRRKQYGSTEAFLADTKWIHHNSVIFNTFQAKLTSAARSIVKVCRQEMAEIENCPDCYLNAHTRKESWFIEVCRRPHMLVWAKLKGFPFWPAKAMKVNKESAVDVRFFGAHDRAWVPVRDCYLYSREMPSGMKQKKRNNLEACIEEVEQHAMRLKERFGAFSHAPPRTAFDPEQQEKQLNMLLPNYQPGVDGKRARTILHPEISSSSRTPGKAATPGSANSTMAKESVPSNEKQTAITPTTSRSGRLSSTSQKKSMYPVVVIPKQETLDAMKQADNGIESSHDDEDKAENSNLGESVESISEEKIVVSENDTKLAEEQAISAIIKATKAMEETLGLPASQSDTCDSKGIELDEEELEDQNLEECEEKESEEQDNNESLDRSNNSSPSSPLRTSPSPVPDSPIPDIEDEMSNHSIIKDQQTQNDTLKSLVNVSITKIPSKSKVSKTDNVVLADSTESIVEQNSQSSETHTEPDLESVKNESEEDKDENIISDAELEGESPKKVDELSDVNSASSTMRSEPASDIVMSAGEDEESDHPDGEDVVQNKTNSKDPIVPKISIKLLKHVSSKKEEDKKSASDVPSVTITAENCTPNETSSEKKITRLNEVQITPIEKVKRKLPDTSSNSISSDLSSDSESEHNVSESKKKKTERSKKNAQNDNEDAMETENPQNSPRPSNTDDDSIFPSLFLDPSVTITVVENSNEKKGDVTAQELCASVKLSSDVSLTIVDKSKSPDKQSHSSSPSPAPSTTSEVSSTSKKPLPPLKGKSKARKSFAPAPPPKQLISVRNPSTLLANGNRSPPTTEQQNAGSAMQKELLVTAIQGARDAREARQSNMMPGPNIPLPPPNPHRPPNHRGGPPQLPQLQPRPFSGHFPPGPPSEAGPATAELNKHAGKLTEFVRQSLESLIRDLASLGSPQASLGAMQLEMERISWRHQQEMAELKHNADIVVLEMRASMESERARALAEVRRQSEIEKQRAIEDTKKKQWCAFCNKEALFYCCWNTSYCDYPCQQSHWPRHMATCAQKYSKDGSSNNPNPPHPPHPPHGPNAPKAAYHGTTQSETTERASPWLPEREDEPSPPQKSTKWSGKRKRCGQCDGCAVTQNCGVCAPCKNSRTHQVCRERRCHTLEESERQRWLASQPLLSNIKKNPQPKGLPPNVQLTQQQLVMGAPGMPGNRPPQHFAIVPRPMQGGGMPQFAMYPAGGSPRAPMGSQTSHVAFPMQPHFFM